ncbi:MAG: acetyl-CoA carboxylase biotin carboxylase subunit [Candidatus Eisenbacteria bacterium]|nr:acetyl-CoA carboxylase biotin carboxylase subunit [Candidatus Latescibacterota bacterium]MBD3302368.1 acetyl-CoA carboxylase biotin carboxylase subunit [Candidatus Eisenbacteria bacterium]
MIRKVLIANRGEIALRIIRACRELGIATVAVYSEADADSLPVETADESVCIGPPRSRDSYLNIPRIMSAAQITNVDAIHPGYGFLAENAQFAEACESSGLVFIGPPSRAIREMGDKAVARAKMRKAGVPILKGSAGVLKDVKEAEKTAQEIGYPVIVKAKDGGGGKGMRVVHRPEDLERLYAMAQAEAEAAFNSGALYMERFLQQPRHIEIQVVADRHGHVIHLGERDCSIQRRHQKLIEEAPSPALNPSIRKRMGQAAAQGAKRIGYHSLGTIEFLFEEKTGEFYFMEMNTRLQVEHPVTELVTGIDLVKLQIEIAAGEKLPIKQDEVRFTGHSIECRINAEDPQKGFRPSPGEVSYFHLSGGPGVRIDSHIVAGSVISPHYDSMVAKLIVHGRDRDEALHRMQRALQEARVDGVATTIPFHLEVFSHLDFRGGRYDTGFLDRYQAAREVPPETRGAV